MEEGLIGGTKPKKGGHPLVMATLGVTFALAGGAGLAHLMRRGAGTEDAPAGEDFEPYSVSITTAPGKTVEFQGGKHKSGRFFHGIPYGKAGRFQEAVEPDFSDVVDCTKFRHACMRPSGHWQEDMSEDCLHLNVYAPLQPEGEVTIASPVLIWFHGGSYTMGAGSDTHKENVEEWVSTHRVVVVTINYRLGAFGFLGSDRMRAQGDHSTGNFGTMDQQLALKWVNKYITHFGGDPEQVTVIGWSAGAASTSVHLSMPGSEGLFRYAIMLSGGFTDWAAQHLSDAEADYDKFVTEAGCHKDQTCLETGPVCECLLKADALDLLGAELKVPVEWAPTVDGAVLPLHPIDAMAQQQVHRGVKIIIGSTVEDALDDIGADATEDDLRAFMNTSMKLEGDALEEAMGLYLGDAEVKEMMEFGANKIAHDGYSAPYWAARRAKADMGMTCKARNASKAWEAAAGTKAHWYLWEEGSLPVYLDDSASAERRLRSLGEALTEFENRLSVHRAPADEMTQAPARRLKICWPCPGAGHGSDLPFLFEVPSTNAEDALADLADMYHTMFANFVRHGDPNVWFNMTLSDGEGSEAWQTAESGGLRFLADYVRMDHDMRGEFCDFWDKHR